MVHELKCWPIHYRLLIHHDLDYRKTFEFRLNDRNYSLGDILKEMEYLPESETYTGRASYFLVTSIMEIKDHVIMSVRYLSPCDIVPPNCVKKTTLNTF